jgi:peptidoglycan hydrolase-like protein with peptidoglycan-binding domain
MAEALRAPRRKVSKAPAHGAALRIALGSLAAARRQPLLSLALVVFGGLAGVTVVNALAMQTNRHPALLFAEVGEPAAPRAKALQRTASFEPPKSANGFSSASGERRDASDPFVMEVQSELARRGLYTGAIDGMTGEKTEAAIRRYEADAGLPVTGEASPKLFRRLATAAENGKAPAAKDTDTDPLRGVIMEATPPGGGEIDKMRSVQQALNALGLGPLDEDGIAGAATRRAIESFERSRKLPLTGEASPKTVKALFKAAGIASN